MDQLAKTVIVDIDGCILAHQGQGASWQWRPHEGALLPDVIEAFDAWERNGYYIILMTSRKDSCRDDLEEFLRSRGLFWDILITGIPHGRRDLINDKKGNGTPGCLCHNLKRNEGLGKVVDI